MKPRKSLDQLALSRIKLFSLLLVAMYCGLGLRLFYIQVVRSGYFHKRADARVVKKIIFSRRGTIYDRNGRKLAVSVDAYDIFIYPQQLKPADRAAVARKLAPLVGWTEGGLLKTLETRKTFTYLLRRADVEVWEKVKKENVLGVDASATVKRVYPGGTLAAHILGFTNFENDGVEGLEKAYDKHLRGTDGYTICEMDARNIIIPTSKRERVDPVNGKDIVLTIDSTLQHTMEIALAKSYNDHSAVGASAVMIDPKSGEILALANMPTYDPNHPGDSTANKRRDRAVTDLYEPGSTLKMITAAGALEDKVITASNRFFCSGSMRIGRRTVRCSLHAPFMNGHGSCDFGKMLKYSCNMAAAGIGMRLGKERLYHYEREFGLYEAPGTGLPGEISGWHDRWQDWPQVRVANISFGQGIAMTPMQLTKAYCAVANKGLLMRPFIVKEIHDLDGKPAVVFNPKLVRRVISSSNASLVANALQDVVMGGTGKTAQVEGYRVAGKTGSAQKAVNGSYANGKFIASFVGFLPVSDPRVVILVAVDEPQGTHWGATVAAPVFQQAAREAMWRLKVAPDNAPVQQVPMSDDDSAKPGGQSKPNAQGVSGRPLMGG